MARPEMLKQNLFRSTGPSAGTVGLPRGLGPRAERLELVARIRQNETLTAAVIRSFWERPDQGKRLVGDLLELSIQRAELAQALRRTRAN